MHSFGAYSFRFELNLSKDKCKCFGQSLKTKQIKTSIECQQFQTLGDTRWSKYALIKNVTTWTWSWNAQIKTLRFNMPFVNLWLRASILLMLGTMKTVFYRFCWISWNPDFPLRRDLISEARESNLLGLTGWRRGTWVTSQFHLEVEASTNQSLATNPDILLVEGSRVISHFHFRFITQSHCTRLASESICIFL